MQLGRSVKTVPVTAMFTPYICISLCSHREWQPSTWLSDSRRLVLGFQTLERKFSQGKERDSSCKLQDDPRDQHCPCNKTLRNESEKGRSRGEIVTICFCQGSLGREAPSELELLPLASLWSFRAEGLAVLLYISSELYLTEQKYYGKHPVYRTRQNKRTRSAHSLEGTVV